MNNKVDLETRLHFRDWLRDELRQLDFYQRRGDHYLIREFAKYCVEKGAPIDEASLGRYLRDDEPVLPTPERCRSLARVFGYEPVKVLIHAGYLEGDDMFTPLPVDASADAIAEEKRARRELVTRIGNQAKDAGALAIIVEQMQQAVEKGPAPRPVARKTRVTSAGLDQAQTKQKATAGHKKQREAAGKH